MKFTAGYLLGATTVVGVVGSFFAGCLAMDYIQDMKKAGIAKVEDTTMTSVVKDIMKARDARNN